MVVDIRRLAIKQTLRVVVAVVVAVVVVVGEYSIIELRICVAIPPTM